MKIIKYIYIGFFSLALFGFTSCELTGDLDDEEIEFSLDAETAIKDENTATLALMGAYAGLTSQDINSLDYIVIPSALSGGANAGIFGRFEEPGYANNDPITIDTRGNSIAYGALYSSINDANWIIEKVNELPDNVFSSPSKRSEIIAEAKGIRATAHFNLLRLWGQFYDVNSTYGIVIKDAPVKSADVSPRSTVAESYNAILADLDDVIANASDFSERFFITKTYGKGMKARVLLYQGNYAEAATLAKEVIDSSDGNFALSSDYASIFDSYSPAIFDNTDIIFGAKIAENSGGNNSLWYGWNLYYSVGPMTSVLASGSTTIGSQNIVHDSNRISSTQTLGFYGGFLNKKLGDTGGNISINFLRISELYLIFAEASARATNFVTSDALNALNTIRERVGATTTGADGFETYPATITLDEFLEAVRIEKTLELFGEMGEEWYDLVRYDYADGFGSGFQVSDVKATATNSDKFILPIDEKNLAAGNNIVVQNPGY